MLIPTKFTTLEESTIFKMRSILKERTSDETVIDVLGRTLGDFDDISEFLSAMDVLYVLGAIDVDTASGIVNYAY